MSIHDRRSFLAYFSSLGLSSTLFPGVLWAKLEETKASRGTASNRASQIKESSDIVITKDDAARCCGRRRTRIHRPAARQNAGGHEQKSRSISRVAKNPARKCDCAATLFQSHSPGDENRPHEAADPHERASESRAAQESRGCCVLAGDATRRTDSHEAGDVRRTD